ncbi:MAG: hypothetical protein FJZ43_04185 [Candidatus Staskawiczbacteria bacterium]|nr:hypothetical protein [Candidatus Staskawiczbacteria bacterium]
MAISNKLRNFIENLQKLPETKKKIIFFSIIIFLFVLMAIFVLFLTKKNLGKISNQLSSFSLPKVEFPDVGNTIIESNIQNISNIIENTSEGDSKIFQDKENQ